MKKLSKVERAAARWYKSFQPHDIIVLEEHEIGLAEAVASMLRERAKRER